MGNPRCALFDQFWHFLDGSASLAPGISATGGEPGAAASDLPPGST
jgi:hypothetical protein